MAIPQRAQLDVLLCRSSIMPQLDVPLAAGARIGSRCTHPITSGGAIGRPHGAFSPTFRAHERSDRSTGQARGRKEAVTLCSAYSVPPLRSPCEPPGKQAHPYAARRRPGAASAGRRNSDSSVHEMAELSGTNQCRCHCQRLSARGLVECTPGRERAGGGNAGDRSVQKAEPDEDRREF
jgi:hypothetical protein